MILDQTATWTNHSLTSTLKIWMMRNFTVNRSWKSLRNSRCVAEVIPDEYDETQQLNWKPFLFEHCSPKQFLLQLVATQVARKIPW